MSRPLRLMSWNVRSLRDDKQAVAETIRALNPDVLFVQEAPRFLRARSKLAALAREAGLVIACGGKSAAGVALLVDLRVDVDDVREILLPKSPGLHQRGLAMATVSLGARRFVAGSIHLGLQPQERLRHASAVAKALNKAGLAETVVSGDLNETASGSAWQLLAKDRDDTGKAAGAKTFPSRAPRRRIDTILVPTAWQVTSVSPTEIVSESTLIRATDHRPVVVDVMG